MTMNDIRKIYTQKVAELLAQGYQINPETMNGSQGEMAHIDLTNGSEILRILIENNYWEDHCYGNVLSIRVGRCNDELRGSWQTIWNSRLETLSEIKLAKISETFYTSLEEGQRMDKIRRSRWERQVQKPDRELGDAYKLVALRWLRRQPRMKSCKLTDINRMTRTALPDGRICFKIEARCNTFYLQA